MANTYELVAQALANGFLPTTQTDYSLANPYQLIRELNDCVTQNFERAVVNARQGYWLHNTIVTLTAGQARVRVPHRCAAGGLDRLEIADTATSEYSPLDTGQGRQALQFEGTYGMRGPTRRYEQRGEWIHLLPVNDTAGRVLRIWYYVRPSKLVIPQSPTLTNTSVDIGVSLRGRITSIADIANRKVTVNAIPYKQRLTTPTDVVAGTDQIDIVKPNGWYELALVDASFTSFGFVLTLGGTDPLDDVEVGDYVRAADETDWPCIPQDFHRLLADLGCMSMLVQLHYLEKAQAYGEKAAGDMDRFRDIIKPRNKDQGAVDIDFPDHVLNGGAGGAGRRGAWGA